MFKGRSHMTNLEIDPHTTALVFIDLQNGLVSRPLAPHSGPVIIQNALRLADAFREVGGTVVFVRVDVTDMISLPVDTPTRAPNTPAPPAAASQLTPEIVLGPKDLVITKRQWGAFYGTELDQQLRRRGIQTVIMGGIATNFGVESTARAAFDRGYKLIFAEDAMSSISEDAHKFANQVIFPRVGRVRTTEQILATVSD